jgi:hypothetical protein
MIKSQKHGWVMIYVTTHCEKDTTILSTEFVIHKPLKNCEDRTEPPKPGWSTDIFSSSTVMAFDNLGPS